MIWKLIRRFREGPKTIVHVNQHKIRANTKRGEGESLEPVLTVKDYKPGPAYGHEVIIYGQDGKEAARIKHRPDKPLSCGARVWIETTNMVEVFV